MKFPPSPKNQKAAVEFVSSLPKESRESDFRSVSKAMLSCFTMGTIASVFAVRSIDTLPWFKIVLSMVTLGLGIFFFVLAYRLYVLLQVFDDGRSFKDRLDDNDSTNS